LCTNILNQKPVSVTEFRGRIESIERHDKDGVKIFFLNATDKSDFEILVNVEPKGFLVLTDLNLLKPAALNTIL
jgi:hypothetical protein